jgi:hypothetical protein
VAGNALPATARDAREANDAKTIAPRLTFLWLRESQKRCYHASHHRPQREEVRQRSAGRFTVRKH